MHDLSCFDEDALWDRHLKCMTICGLCLRFSGNGQYCDLKVENMCTGKFEAGHPCDFCEGCVGANNLSDKKRKISLKIDILSSSPSNYFYGIS